MERIKKINAVSREVKRRPVVIEKEVPSVIVSNLVVKTPNKFSDLIKRNIQVRISKPNLKS